MEEEHINLTEREENEINVALAKAEETDETLTETGSYYDNTTDVAWVSFGVGEKDNSTETL